MMSDEWTTRLAHESSEEPEGAEPPQEHSGDRYWNRGRINSKIAREVITLGPITLPVIRDNTPAGQARVPRVDKNFHLSPSEAVVLANSLRNAEPSWVWGPSGTGKTSGIKQLCAMLNWPLYRVNMTSDFTVADFVGQTQVVIDDVTKQAVTRFSDGLLINAMLNGGVLLIDEVTATPAGVLMALQAVLERSDADLDTLWREGETWCAYVNTEGGGEVIHAHPRFRILVTDNTNGQGDVTGAFAGTNVMNEAFRSRFTQWYKKGFPKKLDWVKILTSKTSVSRDIATRIVNVAIDVNTGSALLGATNVTNESTINPRNTLAVARLYGSFGDLVVAFNTGLLNSMHSDSPDRQFIRDLVRNREGTAK